MDTLRADHLGVYGEARPLTPNLDAFAGSAVLFEHTYSQANTTLMSHASLFTSLYPSELGMVANEAHLPSDAATLAGVLSLYGYQTGAFTAGGQLLKGYGHENGFATYETPQMMGSLFHTVPAALDWLDHRDADKPFFLFVHGYDAHCPYLKPAPYGTAYAERGYTGPGLGITASMMGTEQIRDGRYYASGGSIDVSNVRIWDAEARTGLAKVPGLRLTTKDTAYVRDVYDGAVSYADGWFGYFMGRLAAEGLLDQVVVIAIADHGESLGENGVFNHVYGVSDDELHVPLLVRMPGGAGGGRRVSAQTALLDVMPTVLDLAGATAPAGIHGNSLRPWLEGKEGPGHDYVFSEGLMRMISARSEDGRGTFVGADADSPLLPTLLRSAALDGPAWQATADADPTARARYRDALVAWRQSLKSPPFQLERTDPSLVQEMQKRGYWSPE
jgi:arylsulfatase A-like enzyme